MCRRKTVSEKVSHVPAVYCNMRWGLCSKRSLVLMILTSLCHVQDFLDAVTKVIKGLSKFSATPAYMVRCVM